MPVRPENKHFYAGPGWQDIRRTILQRAGNRCEQCKAQNATTILRGTYVLDDGKAQATVSLYIPQHSDCFYDADTGTLIRQAIINHPPTLARELLRLGNWKLVRIILTIAHLDHNPANNDPTNLKALCQRCHNRHDRKHRAETRRLTRQLKENNT